MQVFSNVLDDNEITEVQPRHATTLSRLLQGQNKIDLPPRKVPFKKLLMLNKPDWPLVLAGVLLLLFVGAVLPILSLIFTNVLRVSLVKHFCNYIHSYI